MAMKYFATEIGAIGFLEEVKAAGPTTVLMVLPKRERGKFALGKYRVTFGNRYSSDNGWLVIAKQEVK